MTQKVATRELEKQLRKEPDNLALRLRLAASYREAGRAPEAVQLYRSVAVAYHAQRRLAQAIAVCRSVLDIEPGQPETVTLLAELEEMKASGAWVSDGGTGTFEPATPAAGPPVDGRDPRLATSQTRTPTGEVRTIPKPATGETRAVARPTTGPLASETSSPGMPAVRMLDKDVSVRELTPVRSVQRPPQAPARTRPSTAPRPAASPLAAATPPASPTPTPTPAPRSSAPEDTPLPKPVPFHDVGEDSMVHLVSPVPQAPAGLHASPPSVSPTTPPRSRLRDLPEGTSPPVPRRDAPDAAEVRARAVALTAPAETRMPLPAEPPPTTLPAEPRGRLAPPRLPTPNPDDDDAVTHVSGDWPIEPRRSGEAHRAQTRPATALPVAPSSIMDLASDLDTRRLRRLTTRDIELLSRASRGSDPGRTDADEEPTHPPPAPHVSARVAPHPGGPPARALDDASMRPSELPAFARGPRRLDVGAPWGEGEEVTDARPMPSVAPEPMHPGPLFDRPFAETLQGLGPDGSAIEAPTTGLLGVFSTLPADAVAELERQMIVRHVVPGETILREGDRGDSCFVIGAGEVRVLKSDPLGTDMPRAEPIEVARLGDGALFGEFALLADRRRHATVEAVTACELYEIPRRLLRELAAGHPEVGPALERFYRVRLLSTLLTTAPFFKPLPEDQRAELLARFTPLHADAGHAIVREGEAAGGFYLIVLGAVDIVRRQSERRPLLLATLREGAYFGEMSLMSGHEASASVIAAGPIELAYLPPKAFYDIVSAHPKLWAAMRAEVRHRELENARIVAGDSSAV